MNTIKICPGCRKPLAPNAPDGLCPECLMKAGLGTGVAPGPGQPARPADFTAPSVTDLAPLFPQLEILHLLGQGGMGAVYKARQPALDRPVALKILPPQRAGDTGFAERFTREARALARLGHPNIVAVHDFGKAGDFHYFIMELVEGANLRQIEKAGKLPSREALQIIPQICEALQFAHDEGIVHRDIKPENILLDHRGRVKIADFGIARIVGKADDAALTGANDIVGTPHYMAPEQMESPQTVDHRADIYSLGVVFYEMLTGELPLGKFQPPSRKVSVDVRLDDVVLHALEREPERRYQRASQIKTDVETIAAAPGCQSAHPEAQAQPSPLEIRRAWMMWYGFIVSLVGLPAGLALGLPWVSGLALAGAVIGAYKLGMLKFLALPGTECPLSRPPIAKDTLATGSGAALQSRNTWEATLTIGTMLFLVILAVVFNEVVPSAKVRLRAAVALMLAIGLGACALSVAGIWPFPSSIFPEPNFSSRNLKRLTSEHLFSPMGLALMMGAIFTYALGILGGILVSLLRVTASDQKAILVFIATALVAPLLARIALHASAERTHRQLLKFCGALGFVVSLPLAGFGGFFLLALIEERGRWNPAPGEAVIVPLIWIGALLVPICGYGLWRAATREQANQTLP